MERQFDLTKFKHSHTVTVRNYEIDWQGIVHNGNYLLYFEIARVEYFKAVGMQMDERSITGTTRIVIVRNELDHFASATFDDALRIYTRVTAVKNSSIRCEAVMMHVGRNIPIAHNVAVMVWTDPKSGTATPVPNDVRRSIDAYESGSADIHWPSIEV